MLAIDPTAAITTKRITMNTWFNKTVGTGILLATSAFLFGTELNAGDTFFVTHDRALYTYNLDGSVVSQVAIPGDTGTEYPRDLVVLDDSRIAVYNGTFNPELSVYDGQNWQHTSIEGWSTVNNVSYGGIANIGSTIYLTDMATSGGEAKGLVVIDADSNLSQRYNGNSDYTDITLGKDGLLYALRDNYGALDVIDPAAMATVRNLSLGHTSESRAVTANANGEIYMAGWYGNVSKFDADGTLVTSLDLGENLTDIDLDASGRILVGSRFGKVFVTDENLDAYAVILVGSAPTFVAAAPEETVPELTGSHEKWRGRFKTTLTWNSDATEVDVYQNDTIIDTAPGNATKTYIEKTKGPLAYKVCEAGTSLCSEPYVVQ
jgi:hypothetical protein